MNIVAYLFLDGNYPSGYVEPKLVRAGEMGELAVQNKTHVLCCYVAANFNEKMWRRGTIQY